MSKSKYRLIYQCPKATTKEHKKMEKYNYKVFKKCFKLGDLRWATIALFYSTLHKVQRLIIRNNPKSYPKSHESRRNEIGHLLEKKYPNILVNYMNLEAKSREARYCPTISMKWGKKPNKQMIEIFLKDTEKFFKKIN